MCTTPFSSPMPLCTCAYVRGGTASSLCVSVAGVLFSFFHFQVYRAFPYTCIHVCYAFLGTCACVRGGGKVDSTFVSSCFFSFVFRCISAFSTCFSAHAHVFAGVMFVLRCGCSSFSFPFSSSGCSAFSVPVHLSPECIVCVGR